MKVLHLIEGLGSGGAERLLHTNLRYLDRGAVESEVVTVFSAGDYWQGRIEGLGIPVGSLDCGGYRDFPSGVRRLRSRLKESRPDLIHTHLWTANVIGRIAGRWSRIPVISSIHSPEYETEASAGASRALRRKIEQARVIDKWTARFGCWRMIAVSKYVKECMVARLRFPADRIDVLYNPIDTSERGDGESREAILESLGLPADAVLLLNVGRLSPEKGFIHAVRAMPEILKAEPNARLISIGAHGNTAYKALVADEITRLGIEDIVVLAGERRDVGTVVAICDVFVFPSLFEGLGIALAEAMVAGRACVASRIRPLDEFVKEGESGLMVEPGSSVEIAKAVISLIGDPVKRASLGDAAVTTAKGMFSPEPAAQRLLEIYRFLYRETAAKPYLSQGA